MADEIGAEERFPKELRRLLNGEVFGNPKRLPPTGGCPLQRTAAAATAAEEISTGNPIETKRVFQRSTRVPEDGACLSHYFNLRRLRRTII